MNNSDRPKFANLMKVLGETYGNLPVSKERVEIYFRVLSQHSIEEIERGIFTLLETRKTTTTFPVPWEIKDAIGGGQDAALIALDKAERAIQRYSSYETVIFDDPVIHMVISAIGGWPKFCCPSNYGDDREWHWIQKDFTRLYEMFSKNPREEFPVELAGLTAITNAQGQEKWIPSPRICGDENKALEWIGKKRAKLLPGVKNEPSIKRIAEVVSGIGKEITGKEAASGEKSE